MASKYWIKLYHEILEDPKMGRLDDSTWRLAIECFLMAGEVDQGGLLGTTEEIAWKLRRPCNETLHELLRKLNACNILVLRDDNTWFVKKFKERQKAVSGAERVQQYRKRQAQKGGSSATSTKKGMATRNESVTKSYTDTDTDTDINEGGSVPPSGSHNSSKPKPLAVHAYRKVAHLYPDKALWQTLDETIGDKPADLEFWEQVVTDWIGCGWRKTNLKGMLDHYKRRELPTTGGETNGHKSGSGKSKATGTAGGGQSGSGLTDAYLENNAEPINRKFKSTYRS